MPAPSWTRRQFQATPEDVAAACAAADQRNRLAGESTAKSIRSAISSLRMAVRQGQPGQWASDHQAESLAFHGWNYIAIHAIGKLLMRAEVNVYEPSPVGNQAFGHAAHPTKDDTVPVSKDHRLLKLLRRPNKFQSGRSFRYEQVVQLSLTGSCIVWKVRNAFGLTVERYVLPTAVCAPIDPCRQLPMGGFRVQPWGNFTPKDAQGFSETIGYRLAMGQIVAVEDCVITRLPHPIVKGDGFGPTAAVAPWIDTARNLDQSRWAQMHNGPDPTLLVDPPESFTQEEVDAYELALNAKLGGPANHGKIFVAAHKNVHPLSTTPKDMSYETGFVQLADAILAAHGTSKAAVGFVDGMTYGSIAATIRAWVELSGQPIADLLADEDMEQQAPEFGEDLTIEYACPKIDDPELIERQIQTDITAGTITKGELRQLRGRSLFGDSRDDELAGPPQLGAMGALPGAGGLTGGEVPGGEPATGEFAGLSRLQLKRNMKAIDDVLDAFAAGTYTEQKARTMLSALGLTKPTIDGLLTPPNDEVEKEVAAGQVTKTMHQYATIMALFPIGIANDIRRVASVIPASILTEKGLETEPHLTIKFGLLPVAPARVARMLQSLEPLTLTIGNMAVFEADDTRDYDVVVLEVESEDAMQANLIVSENLAHREDDYEYRPHITLGYVKAGHGKKFAGECPLSGQVITIDRVVFSGVNGVRTTIPLAGQPLDTLYGSVLDRMKAPSANGNGNGH